MIKLERTEVMNFENAIRGARNPMNSWKNGDSGLVVLNKDDVEFGYEPIKEFVMGKNDLDLAKRLCNSGSDHRKFLRQIMVSVDITAPLYWWKEFDTYKVGTVANSCSTMHKIHAKEFTLDDFSCEHLNDWKNDIEQKYELVEYNNEYSNTSLDVMEFTIQALNQYRNAYLETKNKRYWWYMIQLLPSSYNQMRTVTFNYEVLRNMYHSRKHHKLTEWSVDFVKWVETLPYAEELIIGERNG